MVPVSKVIIKVNGITNYLDVFTEQALSEAEERIFEIMKRACPSRCFDRTTEFMKIVREACEHDKNRNGPSFLEMEDGAWRRHSDFSRLYPVKIGHAANLTNHPNAGIYLVDSTTKPFGQHPLMNLKIQAKVFRPYLPWRGNRNDKSYHIFIKQNLWGELGDRADEITNKIMATTLGPDGMYKCLYPNEFRLFAPRMALLYANLDGGHRAVLMLRPNEKYLHHLEYKTYCYVVASALLKRFNGTCDLDFIKRISEIQKKEYQRSIIITDDMLVTKFQRDTERVFGKRNRIIVPVPYNLERPEILLAA